jgi:IS30 family transposase
VGGCYRALSAQELTEDRRRQALRLRPRKLQRPELLRFVQEGLRLRWSPEQIAGRWRRIRRPRRTKQVSYQTIYNWIWEKKAQGQQWHVCLRHRPKRGRRRKASGTDLRGKIPNRVPMEHRPEVVASKARMGDWESDSLIGGHYSGLIATHVERCSQYLVMAQVGKRDWRLYNRATEAAFARHDSRLPLPRHTTTADNGQEFWGHEALGKSLGLQVYFAPPHQPWQRGLNEQVNGLIRQFLPKGSDLTAVSQKRLEQVEELLNNRPRKTLRYQTPVEVLRKHLYASRI